MHVGPVRPEDEAPLLAFYRGLSEEARALRFFTRTTDEALAERVRKLVDVDYVRRFGLVATIESPPRIVGMRCTRHWMPIGPRSPLPSLLTGFRGQPPHDAAALEDALVRISAMAEDLPGIAELDCNPILVHERHDRRCPDPCGAGRTAAPARRAAVTAPMATRVLVVDDEENIVDLVRSYLTREGFEVDVARDGPAGLARARTFWPDVVVLDIMLPGPDGVEVLRQLRRESSAYVVMLTAKAEETDKIVGLSVGADDYITKPFSLRELVARIRAMLRRSRGGGDQPHALVFRSLRVDPAKREVWKNEERHVLTREQLIQRVWGPDYFGDDRVVDAHVKELRRKLGDDASQPRFIQTVRRVGYKFGDEPV